MDRAEVVEAVDVVIATRARPNVGREALVDTAGVLARLRSWVDAAAADIAGRLAQCSPMPEADLAGVTRTGQREAARVLERAEVLDAAPAFATALDAATLTAGHVDALGATLRSLEPNQRDQLLERVEQLAGVAEHATVPDFARLLRREAARLRVDDGVARLERQRRDCRLRTWVDAATGMWHLAGRFDPENGVRLSGRLDATIAGLFAETVPEGCPSDAREKQDHLRALALAVLTDGRDAGCRRAEITVVVDTTDPDPVTGAPTIDWGLPVELPMSVLHDLAGRTATEVHAVVVRNGVILHAPGPLELGRSTRLANRAQRRALCALYRTCAVPGCEVRYSYCKLHHIIWWEHGGLTNLDNLLPVCERHHHAIHDLGWAVGLGPRRELTVDLPDGTRLSTGPPRRVGRRDEHDGPTP